MAERNLKDADQDKAIHAMRQEHRINRVVLPIAALYVVFLMWTALTNFSLALKIATVAFLLHLFISLSLIRCICMTKSKRNVKNNFNF